MKQSQAGKQADCGLSCHGAVFLMFTAGKYCGLQLMKNSVFKETAW